MIVRIVRRENPFAQIDRRILDNPALSWKAKGLLSYLLSKPPEWVVRLEDLVNSATDGEDSVRTALRELKKAGHARLETVRSPTSGLVSGKRWVIFEDPEDAPEGAVTIRTEMGKSPTSENTDIGEIPTSGKSGPSNTEQSSKKESLYQEPGDLFAGKLEPKVSPLPPALSTPEVLEAWQAFEEMRKKKRAAITPAAKARIVADLLSWGPELAKVSLWKSARNNWTDVYFPRENGAGQKATNTTTTNGAGKKKITAADAL